MAQTKDKGFFTEMSVGHGRNKWLDKYQGGYTVLAPALGYQLNDAWAISLKAQLEVGEYREFHTGGLYAQYAFLQAKQLKVFAEGGISFSIDERNLDGGTSKNYMEAGVTLGASYGLTKHLSAILRYPYIG